MILKFLLRYCGNRQCEWEMALIIFVVGFWASMFPGSIAIGAFRPLLQILDQDSLGGLFILVGCFRLTTLVANGAWELWGPRLRAFGAAVGAVFWGQMGLALLIFCFNDGTPPPLTIPVYFVLAFGEVFSCYRVLAGHSYGPG